MNNNSCKIDYESWLLHLNVNSENISIPIVNKKNFTNLIPARCEIVKQLSNFDVDEDSVILSNEIFPGIFCANTIISKGRPYVKIINTTTKDVVLPQNYAPIYEPLANFYYCTLPTNINETSSKERAQKLKTTLNFQHKDSKVKAKLEKLCVEFNDIFSLNGDKLSVNNFYKQNITLNNNKPVYIKNYRLPESQKAEINSQVQTMLNDGIIQNSTSPYNSPILLVPKKSPSNQEKKWRLVIDYRQLNKQITPDKFPLPRIDEILDQLGRAKYLTSCLDFIKSH